MQRKKAFTLIELLSVTAVISVLAALLLPVLGKAKESARSAKCMNNLRQIGLAMNSYASDNDDILPFNDRNIPNGSSTSTYASKLIPYLAGSWQNFWDTHLDQKDFGLFICPSWKEGEGGAPIFEFPRKPNRDYGASYERMQSFDFLDISPKRINDVKNDEWLVGDAGYRRIINDYNGPIVYGNPGETNWWGFGGFQPRHSKGANLLFVDGHVEKAKYPGTN